MKYEHHHRNIALFVVAILLQLGPFTLRSQGAPGDVDLSFDAGSGVDGPVNAVALQPDGQMIIGGSFTTVKGLARSRIARLNPDGSGDVSFQMDLPVEAVVSVYALALQPDGKVLVGHHYGINRLNSDGSLDPTFSSDIELYDHYGEGGVYTIALQMNGNVLIRGSFSKVNGTDRNGIARLNVNGSLDASFLPGAVLSCHSLAMQPDGKVLVMGVISFSGGNHQSVVRLNGDGSLDDGFEADQEISGPVEMALQADGKIIVVGIFTSGGDGIRRLNANGSRDNSFNPAYNFGAPVAQPDGRVLLSGSFTVDGTLRGMVRLNADGSLDPSFDLGTGAGSGSVLTLQSDGRLIVGGYHSSVYHATPNGTTRNHIARLNSDGSRDASFHPGAALDGRVTTVSARPEGKVLIAGSFRSVLGDPRAGIARLDANGGLDNTFDPEIILHAHASHISTVAVQPDGKLLITGLFATMLENTVQYYKTIARLGPDGSLDRVFDPDLTLFIPDVECNPGFNCNPIAEALDVLVQADGKVLISGYAGHIITGDSVRDESIIPFFARFHADGSRDQTFQLGPEISGATVSRMQLQTDGKLLLAGRFTVNGTVRGMVRLTTDGSLDPSFNLGMNIIGSSVTSIALQSDGKVLIGGYSSMLDTRMPIARLNDDGSVDGTFDPPSGFSNTVQSFAIQPDGKILITGQFGETNYSTVARLNADGSRDPKFNLPKNSAGGIMAVAVQSDGNVLIGGDFRILNGVARPGVARLYGDAAMPSFATWAAGFGLFGGDAAVDADPDGDGVANVVECLLGTDPMQPNTQPAWAFIKSEGTLQFSFTRDNSSAAMGINAQVESGTDLITWPDVFTIGSNTASSSAGVSISENGSLPGIITVTIPQGTDRCRFARLKVWIAP